MTECELQSPRPASAERTDVIVLVYDRLPARFPNARERQLLQAIGYQAGWLIQTTDAMTRMLERERSRIAAELHNDLSQMLAYLHLQVGHALAMLREGRSELASGAMEELTDVALEAYQTVRRAVDDLCSQPAPWETPLAYLQRIARTSASRNKVTIAFETDRAPISLPPRTMRTLAGVLQEAINNAASHGGAEDVQITVRTDDGHLRVHIADNGCGFVPDEARPGHHGLALMRERVEALGGDFAVDGGLGSGATITLFVPQPETLLRTPCHTAPDVRSV